MLIPPLELGFLPSFRFCCYMGGLINARAEPLLSHWPPACEEEEEEEKKKKGDEVCLSYCRHRAVKLLKPL